jgi:hypothetical protein
MTKFSPTSVRRIGLRALLVAPLLLIGQNCTKLTEVPHDALTPDNAFHTDAELLAGVAGVYAQLRAVEWVGYITLEDLTADVSIVPTRGSDWYDNGQWLDLHRQTWTANSSGTLAFADDAWSQLFSGVAKANLMIDVASKNITGAKKDSVIAEMRTLRAWYYYMLQDMFGGVPLATTTELKQYKRATRPEIFAFVDSELTKSIPFLPKKWPTSFYGRVTQGAANAILASLYLNAGVFNKNSGVDALGYNSCTIAISGGRTGCQAAIDAADAVLNSGTYSLSTDWYKNFSADNKSSTENIFVIVHTKETTQGIGGNWPMRTLHYNQLNTGQGGPWNGFATLAETYNAFTATDDRRNMWLAGQAYSFETGQPAKDRTGAPLIFTVQIPDVDQAGEGIGVRFNKFPPIPSPSVGSAQPNDFTFFRLAEMYLIKAEALNEQGNTAGALTQLNTIHNRHDPTNPITATTQAQIRDAILKERLLELAAEGKRRTDMIRHGKFLTWTEASAHGHVSKASEPYRILFPIPSPQLGSNPLLVQNPGY